MSYKKNNYFSSSEQKVSAWLAEISDYPGRRRIPDLSKSALLLVDMQKLFISPESPAFLPAWQDVGLNCKKLIQYYRDNKKKVFWSFHSHPADDGGGIITAFGERLLRRGEKWADCSDEFRPRSGEAVYEKARYSGWKGSSLKAALDPGEVLVAAGVTANRCILSTIVSAADDDQECILVIDACAARNEELHKSTVLSVAGGFGYVCTTKEILNEKCVTKLI